MTELLILGRIIFLWKDSLTTAKKNFHQTSYRFLISADVWILLTLLLAIAMSVPAVNVYTHGTHVTVAHTMGATIGINSFLLMAIAFDILKDTCVDFERYKKILHRGYWIANISLVIFWLSLIGAGVLKAKWQLSSLQAPFSTMMLTLKPFFISFFISGTILTIGFLLMIYPLVKIQMSCYFKTVNKEKTTSSNSSTGSYQPE